MKIGLIAPARSKTKTYYSNNPRLRAFFAENKNVPAFFHPNLALLTLAGLTPGEHQFTLVDERVDTLSFEEDFDLVGITMMTAQAMRGYEIGDRFRARGTPVVMGGIHASVLPEEAAAHCDTVIIGEAENTWPQFLEDVQRGCPKPQYRDQSVDLGKAPAPRYDLLDPAVYALYPVQTTRGCPHGCDFCSVTTVFGPRYRFKHLEQILREVEAVKQTSGNHRLVFNDDNTFVVRKNAYALLQALQPMKMKYFAQSDISVADDEKLLTLLHDSGCTTLFIGFESLVPENLAAIQRSQWKFKHLDRYSESCRRIQAHGIQVLGAFVVGFDHDRRDGLLQLRDFVIENNIWAQIHLLTPFPATRSREKLIAAGRLAPSHTNWDLYTCFDAVFEPAHMSKEEIEDTVVDVYEAVYSDDAHHHRMRYMVDQMKHVVEAGAHKERTVRNPMPPKV